ncbi:MAG: phosphoenolpyruvate--protein phosphotransferase, partial [Spirochaetales bacterium]|nr:phosphoenolpyruvate--protein phosphotransferase [Spirochaetales bacterium]
RRNRPFNRIDEKTMLVLVSQLANILENARSFYSDSIHTTLEESYASLEFNNQILLQGTGTSPGMAFGESFILDRKRSFTELRRKRFQRIYSFQELMDAIKETENQLLELQKNVEENLSDSASLIFTSHLLMLKDKSFLAEIEKLVKTGINPPAALLNVSDNYIRIFSESDNQFVKEKIDDLEDLVQRIISNLCGDSVATMNAANKVVVAKKLYPSDILTMSSLKIAGILMVAGGVTAHISILAQSLKIPLAIIDFTDLMKSKTPVPIGLDGNSGKICINPNTEILEEFNTLQKERKPEGVEVLSERTSTQCGKRIQLLTNINLIPDLEEAVRINAEGVGLYRTEYPFLLRDSFPTEEEQYLVYSKIIEKSGDLPVTFRTLDVGGDKVLSYYRDYTEENPFLGLRSIRFSLQNPRIFKQQIRAILRAAGDKRIKLMFPMISTIEDLKTAKEFVQQAIEELQDEGYKITKPEIGAMIEIPSIVLILDHVCEEVDFLSIGTNDFIQYMLAVDRNNEKLKNYYTPHNPSILRSLKTISDISKENNIELTVCGEMAHQKEYIPFLLGIGIEKLSVSTPYLYRTQKIINNIRMDEAQSLADEILSYSSIYEIERSLGIM